MDRKALPYTLLLGTLFGTSLIASRFCVGQLNPVSFAGLRLSLASLGYLVLYLLGIGGRRWPTDRRLWRNAALLGVFDTAIPMVCILVALQVQSTGVTSILVSIGPAITVLMAHFFLADERLTLSKVIGVGLALGGAVLLGLLGESGLREVERFNPLGYLVLVQKQLGLLRTRSAPDSAFRAGSCFLTSACWCSRASRAPARRPSTRAST